MTRACPHDRRTLRPVLTALLTTLAILVSVTVGAQAPAPESFDTISTASYPLFPIDDSKVHAQLQVVSRTEGGSMLILTVEGIEEGGQYTAALYAGDCGPDRQVVLELEPIGRENDPYVSITETDLEFETITEGDHFIYIFAGDDIDRPNEPGLDAPALACGEVGVGAIAE
ncbi:MAG: hypothetical protein H0U69_11350 [Trueperaceae bacterium]|nr:hypothetical protein [Trueperaceae bacterium]